MSRRLVVNLNGIAQLRENFGRLEPDPVTTATLVAVGGADGVSVQLRADRRHIQDRDARLLRQTVHTGFSLEIAPSAEMLKMALEIRPDAAVLVAERDGELATEGGLDLVTEVAAFGELVRALEEARIHSSACIAPDMAQVKAAHRIGLRAVRIFTGRYSEAAPEMAEERTRIGDAVRIARKLGLGVGISGGLHYRNVQDLLEFDGVDEVIVGHSIVSRALLVGMERAVSEMRALLG